MSDKRFWVEVERSDGSHTYKGPLTWGRASAEASAWAVEFPDYRVSIQTVGDTIRSQNPTTGDWELDAAFPTVGALIKAWTIATKDGNRFYPYGKVGR